jgi:hypothetical protein
VGASSHCDCAVSRPAPEPPPNRTSTPTAANVAVNPSFCVQINESPKTSARRTRGAPVEGGADALVVVAVTVVAAAAPVGGASAVLVVVRPGRSGDAADVTSRVSVVERVDAPIAARFMLAAPTNDELAVLLIEQELRRHDGKR